MENTKDKQELIQTKKKKDRSTPYPSIALEEAIRMAEEVEKALGKGPYGRLNVAQIFGHGKLSGPAIRKVAALSHYNLLERNGDVYHLSTLSKDILHPISDQQKSNALAIAAKAPSLFAKLISEFNGQSLPTRLDSILIRQGISSSVTQEVVKIFSETLLFAGLLKNGVIGDIDLDSQALPLAEDKKKNSSSNIESLDKFVLPSSYQFTDSGNGWTLSIKSEQPLSSNIKKALADVGEELQKNNKAINGN